jgi:glycosyltransferase involved in cell wall biosynthesis
MSTRGQGDYEDSGSLWTMPLSKLSGYELSRIIMARAEQMPRLNDKIVVLRLFRLRHIPPSLYSTELLAEAGAPVVAIEFGNARERRRFVDGPFPRLRLQARWTTWLPTKVRALAIFFSAFVEISAMIVAQGRPKVFLAEGIQEECLAFLLHILFQVPFVVHVHEAYEAKELDKLNRLFHGFGSRVLRFASFVIFPERRRAELYRTKYAIARPVHIAFNCPRRLPRPERLDLRARLSLPANSQLMGYLGGIGKSNAIEEAIVALAEIPQLYFLVWGWIDEKYRTALLTLAKELGVQSRLLFLGELNENKWEHLAGCDVSYCVYRPDRLRLRFAATASNKLMESLAAGVPVITSAEADFREIVETYDVGVCAASITAADIIQALRRVLPYPEIRRRMSENGLRSHRETLNYEVQFARPLAALAELTHLELHPKTLKSQPKITSPFPPPPYAGPEIAPVAKSYIP